MIETFGASVAGPAHLTRGAPNEDAWAHDRKGGHAVIVVSDGLGSRSDSRRGARAACAATLRACWAEGAPSTDTPTLLAAVHREWKREIEPQPAEACACTCLFAVVDSDGRGLLAQIGDGLALVRRSDDVVAFGLRDGTSFANETEALQSQHDPDAWRTLRLEAGTTAIALCTDGVSDDLLPDRYGAFVDWLVDDLGMLSPRERRQALREALSEWPTPRHVDDKTIAALVIRESAHD